MPPPTLPHIALAHDWLVGYRGGEAVLDAIVRSLAGHALITGLYTMFADGRPLTPAVDALSRTVWPPGQSRAGVRLRRWLLPAYPRAVDWLSRRLEADADAAEQAPDLLISTSSAAIHGLVAPRSRAGASGTGRVPHLCYCHSPARYLWSQTDQYAGGVRGLALRMAAPRLRARDLAAANRTPGAGGVTRWLANSTHTQRELMRCFGAPSQVVFPPVRTEYFTPEPETDAVEAVIAGQTLPREFLLCAGAVEPYKRVDLALHAAREADVPLVVSGSGSMLASVRRLAAKLHGTGAPKQVLFLGRVSDADLRTLFRRTRALLHPQIEDFGITAVEAQACGTPVVAMAQGGALDTVIDGTTGVHVHEQSGPALAAGVRALPPRGARVTDACRQNALRFSEPFFAAAVLHHVEDLLGDKGF